MGRAAWCMKLITRLMVVLTNHTCKHDLMVKGFIILVYCINNYLLKCSTDRHINARSTTDYHFGRESISELPRTVTFRSNHSVWQEGTVWGVMEGRVELYEGLIHYTLVASSGLPT